MAAKKSSAAVLDKPQPAKEQHTRMPVKWDATPTVLRSLTGRTVVEISLNERGAGMFSITRDGHMLNRFDLGNEPGMSNRVLLYEDGDDVLIVEPERAGDFRNAERVRKV